MDQPNEYNFALIKYNKILPCFLINILIVKVLYS
jgi:hypothetical protein